MPESQKPSPSAPPRPPAENEPLVKRVADRVYALWLADQRISRERDRRQRRDRQGN